MRAIKILAVICSLVVGLLVVGYFVARSMAPEWRDHDIIAAELETAVAAVEAKRWPRPPLFDEPCSGTAWDCYREVMKFIGTDEAGFTDLEVDIALDLMRSGACTAESGRAFTPRTGMGLTEGDTSGDLIKFAQRIKDLTVARAEALADEDPERAVDVLMVLYRFGEDFPRGGPALSFLVGTTVRNSAVAALAELCIGEGFPKDQSDRVLSWLGEQSASPDLLEVADTEMLAGLRCLEQMATGEVGADELGIAIPSDGDRKAAADTFYRVLDVYGQAYAAARESGADPIGPALKAQLDARWPMMGLSLELKNGVILLSFSRMHAISFPKLWEMPARLQAYRTAGILLIHAARYRRQNGRYPESIDEITRFAGGEFPGTSLLFYRPEVSGTELPAFLLNSDIRKKGAESAKPLVQFR